MPGKPTNSTRKTPPTRVREGAKVTPWRKAKREPHTLQRLEKCLQLLKVHGIINVACRQSIVAGRSLSRQTYYEMRRDHPDFAAEADESMAQAVEELEASGWACARMAQKDPRYLPMLKFALQAKAGWTTRERIEHSGPGGAAIPINLKSEFDALSDDELRAAYRRKLAEHSLAT